MYQSALRDLALFPAKQLDYPYPASTVFSGALGDSKAQSNGNGHNTPDDDLVLGTLLVVDYRYARFALDPRTGLFQLAK